MGTLKRRCLQCMREFEVPVGSENDSAVCPNCGFVENSKPKIAYHLYPGTVLNNRFIVGVVLGYGGFGVTYKAWDPSLGVVVAIKEHFPTQFVQRIPGTKDVLIYDGDKKKLYSDSLERFLEEAKKTAEFDNPNIVHVDSYFEENNTAYIVMEYMDGVDLKNYLKTNNDKFEKGDIDKIILPIIDALKTVHSKGYIHRDLTPGNIRLCTNGTVKLFDFGATFFSDTEREKTRSIILTPGYAPPEQYQRKSIQGPWTDVYGLSATLYRLVTGKDPVESSNRLTNEFEKGIDQLPEPKELDPSVPDYLNDLIMKGMAIEPKLRFQTIDEFEKAYLMKTRVQNPQRERKKRLIIRAVTISAAALLIGIGAFFAYKKYHNMKSKVELDDATISVWISYRDDMSEEEAMEFGENITGDFRDAYPNVAVEIEVIPEKEYVDKLSEAAEAGELPALFMSDRAPDDVMKMTISVKDIFKNGYIKTDGLRYVNAYEKEMMDDHKLPTGYVLPVVYVRKTNNLDMDAVAVSSLEDVEKNNGYVADSKYLDMTAKTLNVEKNQLKTENREEALKQFGEGKISYYLATTDEYNEVNEVAYGRFEMKPYMTEEIYGEFSDYWSIRSYLSDEEKIAAEVVLGVMTDDSPQGWLHIDAENSLPINKDAYEKYIEIKPQYEILDEYSGKEKMIISNEE